VKDVKVTTVANGKQAMPTGQDFYVINYDLVKKKREDIESLGVKLVVFDESQYLKNPKAQRTVVCLDIAENAESVLCLSGTPITNKPKDFFTTLSMVRPSEWKGKKFDFEARYCNGHKNEWGYWDADGVSNAEELHNECRDFMIRRLKTEVLEELPDKVRQTHSVMPTDKEMKEYNDNRNTWVATYQRLKARNQVPAGFILNMLTDLRKHCGRIKVKSAVDWAVQYKESNDKPLVMFTHHLENMEAIMDSYEDAFPDSVVASIHGGVASHKRTEIVSDFQAGEIDLLVCSTTAANMGITLTAADTVVFVEREWVPSYEEQAEDRILRIGATGETVWAVYLTVENTIDVKFKNLIEQKRSVIKSIIDGGEEGQRGQIVKDLLQAMVDAGEIPAEMMESIGGNPFAKKGAKKYD